ncbi:MAG: dockerin type I domain-containing protein [Nanoarchaeota archaeon]
MKSNICKRNLTFEALEDRLNPSNFFSDFSVDPGLETNNPDNYSISEGTFESNTSTNSQEYGTVPVDYKGEDFTLQFDIKVLERSTGDTNIGIFSSSRKTNQSLPGDPTIYVVYGGYSPIIHVRGYNSQGDYFEGKDGTPHFDINMVYHTILTYNADKREATLTVTSDDDANYTTPFVSNISLGEGLPALPHLGISAVGNWGQSGRFQKSEIDNLSFKTINKNPLNARDVNADGVVSPIDALVIINYLNEEKTSQPSSPPFLDVNGDDVVSPIDPLIVINYLNEQSSSEAELVSLSKNVPTHSFVIQPTLSSTLVDKVFEDFSIFPKNKKNFFKIK